MLKNLSIKLRLFAGFGVVLFLAGMLAVIAVYSIYAINGDIGVIVNDRWPKTVLANEMIDNINVVARALRNAIILDDSQMVQKELDRIPEASKVLADNIDKLDKAIKSDKGKQLLNDLKGKQAVYQDDLAKPMQLIKEGKKKEAGLYLVNTLRKTQSAYLAASADLIKYQGQLMEESGKNAESRAKQTVIIIIVLGSVATVLSIGASLFIIRSITIPLAEGVDVATRLAAGDLTEP
jgi:methyl-accepting chemotaxis protein